MLKIEKLATLIPARASQWGKREILFYRDNRVGQWKGITWNELNNQVTLVAKGLLAHHIELQEPVAVMSANKPELVETNFALFSIRAISVPVFATASADQLSYMVQNAKIRVIFVGNQVQYDIALEVMQRNIGLEHIVVYDSTTDLKHNEDAMYFSDFMRITEEDKTYEEELVRRRKSISPKDLAVILYTSGTTGEPKGVMLRGTSFEAAVESHALRLPYVDKTQWTLSFLPLSHIYEHAWLVFCLHQNVRIYLNEDPHVIQTSLKEVRPSMMCNVPRFWEKIAAGVEEKVNEMSSIKKALVVWALDVGRQYNIGYTRLGKKAPLMLRLKYRFADKQVFSTLKKTVGLENGVVFPAGGAAFDKRLFIFFRSLGIPIVTGYGLSETMASVSSLDPFIYNLGTSGIVMPKLQVKIGDNNEILVKGRTVMVGYYNNPELTKEAFIDGWFKTGDAGKLLEDGSLVMTDRIKDLFKTSNGKYIAPQLIETRLGADLFIEQVAVIGNNRNFVTAIIAPNVPAVEGWAKEHKIAYDTVDDLLKDAAVIKLIEERVAESCKNLAPYERVKRFRLIKEGFSMEQGEITATLKLRRAVIQHNYKYLIREMYDVPVGGLLSGLKA